MVSVAVWKFSAPFVSLLFNFVFSSPLFFTLHWVHWHDLELWRSKYCTNSANLFLCALHDWPIDTETLLYLQGISDAQVLDFVNLWIISLIILELGKLIPLPTYINYLASLKPQTCNDKGAVPLLLRAVITSAPYNFIVGFFREQLHFGLDHDWIIVIICWTIILWFLSLIKITCSWFWSSMYLDRHCLETISISFLFL